MLNRVVRMQPKKSFEAFSCGGSLRGPNPVCASERGTKNASERPSPTTKPKLPPVKPIIAKQSPKKSKKTRSKKDKEEDADPQVGGLPEKLGALPLRLIIVGHNPSAHAWKSGHYYSNPSNRMWRILKASGIAPEHVNGPKDDGLMLSDIGVGFTDVGTGFPGTDSSEFSSATFVQWRDNFFGRLGAHLERACSSIGCKCGQCGAPCFVAFAGKRQWIELFNAGTSSVNRIKTVDIGKQDRLPNGWPFPASTQVWVLPSTSGASALTNEQREGPYFQLSEQLKPVPWPREISLTCNDNDFNETDEINEIDDINMDAQTAEDV